MCVPGIPLPAGPLRCSSRCPRRWQCHASHKRSCEPGLLHKTRNRSYRGTHLQQAGSVSRCSPCLCGPVAAVPPDAQAAAGRTQPRTWIMSLGLDFLAVRSQVFAERSGQRPLRSLALGPDRDPGRRDAAAVACGSATPPASRAPHRSGGLQGAGRQPWQQIILPALAADRGRAP